MNLTNQYLNKSFLTFIIGTLIFAGVTFWFRSLPALLFLVSALIAVASFKVSMLRSVGVILAALIFSLSIAEVIALVFEKKESLFFQEPNSDYSRQYFKQTELGSQAKQGVHTSKLIDSDGQVIYDVKYTIGLDGFRVTSEQASDYQDHISFYGCSFTFGEGLNDWETLPFYVNKKVRGLNVKNYGFHGYGAHQALFILERDAEKVPVSQINFFLTAPWHATRSSCKPDWTFGSPKYRIENNELIRVGRCKDSTIERILSYSKLYKLGQRVFGFDAASDADFALYLAIIKKMHNISKQNGSKFIVGFIGADERFFFGTSYTNQKIYDQLKNNSDAIIDLTLAGKVENLDQSYYIHPLDKHPSALANQKRADMLTSLFSLHTR